MASIDQLQGAIDKLNDDSSMTSFLPSLDDLLTEQTKKLSPKIQIQNPGDESTIVKDSNGDLVYGDGSPVYRLETDEEYENRIKDLVNNMGNTTLAIEKKNDLNTLKSEISNLANNIPTLATNAISQLTPVIANPYTSVAAPSIISGFKGQINTLSQSAKTVLNLLLKLGIVLIPDALVALINTLADLKTTIGRL